jgi:hypothetical protein
VRRVTGEQLVRRHDRGDGRRRPSVQQPSGDAFDGGFVERPTTKLVGRFGRTQPDEPEVRGRGITDAMADADEHR